MQIELERSEIVALCVALQDAIQKWEAYFILDGQAGDQEQVAKYRSLCQKLEEKLNEAHQSRQG